MSKDRRSLMRHLLEQLTDPGEVSWRRIQEAEVRERARQRQKLRCNLRELAEKKEAAGREDEAAACRAILESCPAVGEDADLLEQTEERDREIVATWEREHRKETPRSGAGKRVLEQLKIIGERLRAAESDFPAGEG